MAIGASIGSAVLGASSASKASKAQTNAANADRALQKEIYEDQKTRFEPFYEDGLKYAGVRNFLDGIGERPTFGGTAPEIQTVSVPGSGPDERYQIGGGRGTEWGTRPTTAASTEYRVGQNTFGTMDAAQEYANANLTGGTEYQGMQETDAYKFRVNQGVSALESGAAARGGLYSGKTLQDLQTYGQGQANQFESDYYNRIAGGAGQGQAAAGQTAQAAQNYGQASSNAFSNIGNAQAAGAIGVGNALQGGINNGIGMYQYQNSLNGAGGGNSPMNAGPWNFGAI